MFCDVECACYSGVFSRFMDVLGSRICLVWRPSRVASDGELQGGPCLCVLIGTARGVACLQGSSRVGPPVGIDSRRWGVWLALQGAQVFRVMSADSFLMASSWQDEFCSSDLRSTPPQGDEAWVAPTGGDTPWERLLSRSRRSGVPVRLSVWFEIGLSLCLQGRIPPCGWFASPPPPVGSGSSDGFGLEVDTPPVGEGAVYPLA
jgi:hypothetical protein